MTNPTRPSKSSLKNTVHVKKPTRELLELLDREINDFWSEAAKLYKDNEKLGAVFVYLMLLAAVRLMELKEIETYFGFDLDDAYRINSNSFIRMFKSKYKVNVKNFKKAITAQREQLKILENKYGSAWLWQFIDLTSELTHETKDMNDIGPSDLNYHRSIRAFRNHPNNAYRKALISLPKVKTPDSNAPIIITTATDNTVPSPSHSKPDRPLSKQPGYEQPARVGKVTMATFTDPETRREFRAIAKAAGIPSTDFLEQIIKDAVARAKKDPKIAKVLKAQADLVRDLDQAEGQLAAHISRKSTPSPG